MGNESVPKAGKGMCKLLLVVVEGGMKRLAKSRTALSNCRDSNRQTSRGIWGVQKRENPLWKYGHRTPKLSRREKILEGAERDNRKRQNLVGAA